MGDALKFGTKDNLPFFSPLSLETALSSKLLALHCYNGGGWGGGMNKERKRTVKTLSGKEKEI